MIPSSEAYPITYFDSHCHLEARYASKNAADLIREAAEAQVTTLLNVGTEIASIPGIQKISETHPHVYHSIGVHPHDAGQFKAGDLELLKEASRHTHCRAIGETGLDYHYDLSPRDIQRRVFEQELELALDCKLPVIIHSREAEEDILAALRPYASRITGRPPGVIHCFTGTRAFGEACLELGFYISFSGILTFKNAANIQECAQRFPMERILVETDSPFLAPLPYRGKKCEPAMVTVTARKLAELRQTSIQEIAHRTTMNARELFAL